MVEASIVLCTHFIVAMGSRHTRYSNQIHDILTWQDHDHATSNRIISKVKVYQKDEN